MLTACCLHIEAAFNLVIVGYLVTIVKMQESQNVIDENWVVSNRHIVQQITHTVCMGGSSITDNGHSGFNGTDAL